MMKTYFILFIVTLIAAPLQSQVSLHIGSGTTVIMHGGNEIVLTGHWENDGGFQSGQGKVTLTGTGNQSITNSTGETFYDLEVFKSGGLLNIQNDVTVSNNLTMAAGDISTGSNTLQLGTSSEGLLLHTDGTVIGNFARFIDNTTGSRLFPVGTFANYRPLTINYVTSPSFGGIITVNHNDLGGISANINPPLDDAGYVVDRRTDMYWNTNTAGIAGGTYDMSIDGAGQPGILDPPSLRIVHSDDGINFDLVGSHGNGSGTLASRSGISGNTFDRFYLGGNQVDNPLIETISVNQQVRNNWNLLGLPLAVENSFYQTIFPNALPGSLTGFGSGSYTSEDSLDLGKGYFLAFPLAETVSITGFPVNNLAINLEADWNLISGVSVNVPVANIVDPGGIIIPGTIYGFDGAYYPAQNIEQGRAYWIKASAAGQITLPGQSISPLTTPSIAISSPQPDMKQYTTLHIEDAQGRSQTLYLNVDLEKVVSEKIPASFAVKGGEEIDLGLGEGEIVSSKSSIQSNGTRKILAARYENTTASTEKIEHILLEDEVKQNMKQRFSLPPSPPEAVGALDARFNGDSKISETDEAIIHIQASNYPLTIDVSNLSGLLKSNQPEADQNVSTTGPGFSNSQEIAGNLSEVQGGYNYVITQLVDGQESQQHILDESAIVVISDARVKTLKIGKQANIPAIFAVEQNYPNPFNPQTEIRYSVPRDAKVEIIVYNMLGQKIKTLISQQMKAGHHSTVWDATNNLGNKLGSGVFFYVVRAGEQQAVKKMILMK